MIYISFLYTNKVFSIYEIAQLNEYIYISLQNQTFY